jgi:hypothetical protein
LDNDCDGAVDEDAWTPTGSVIDLSADGEEPFSASLEPGADRWALAWISTGPGGESTLHAGVITPGIPDVSIPTLDASGIALSSGEPSEATIIGVPAASGPMADRFLIVAAVPSSGGSTGIVAILIDASGAADGAQTEISLFPASVQDLAAASIPGTSRAGILFRSDLGGDYEIWFAGLDLSGAAPSMDVAPIQITDASGFSGRPSMIAASPGFAFAWEDDRDGNAEVYFAIIDSAGALSGPPRRITAAPGDSQNVSLAATAEGFGLAWMDSREGGYDVLFTCLDSDGARACPEIGMGPLPGEDAVSPSWFPALWNDGTPGQLALAYAGEDAGAFSPMLTAVPSDGDPVPAYVDPGMAIERSTAAIISTALADAGGSRGIAWIEHDTSGNSALVFQQLDCREE